MIRSGVAERPSMEISRGEAKEVLGWRRGRHESVRIDVCVCFHSVIGHEIDQTRSGRH